ncbi:MULTISPECIES: HNH endonuclease [Bradyrhizobium]|uniref:HNH endonuclease n=1 Tax=Bradyrhizobium TaxID=374 RepID=UPI0036224D81
MPHVAEGAVFHGARQQFCTTPNDRLTAHHVIERGTPGATDTLDNLRTLCMRCHNRQHGQRGRRVL